MNTKNELEIIDLYFKGLAEDILDFKICRPNTFFKVYEFLNWRELNKAESSVKCKKDLESSFPTSRDFSLGIVRYIRGYSQGNYKGLNLFIELIRTGRGLSFEKIEQLYYQEVFELYDLNRNSIEGDFLYYSMNLSLQRFCKEQLNPQLSKIYFDSKNTKFRNQVILYLFGRSNIDLFLKDISKWFDPLHLEGLNNKFILPFFNYKSNLSFEEICTSYSILFKTLRGSNLKDPLDGCMDSVYQNLKCIKEPLVSFISFLENSNKKDMLPYIYFSLIEILTKDRNTTTSVFNIQCFIYLVSEFRGIFDFEVFNQDKYRSSISFLDLLLNNKKPKDSFLPFNVVNYYLDRLGLSHLPLADERDCVLVETEYIIYLGQGSSLLGSLKLFDWKNKIKALPEKEFERLCSFISSKLDTNLNKIYLISAFRALQDKVLEYGCKSIMPILASTESLESIKIFLKPLRE